MPAEGGRFCLSRPGALMNFTSGPKVLSSSFGPNVPACRGPETNSHFTLTGALADHRLRCPASQIAAFAYALAGKILAATKDANLGSVIGTLKAPAAAATPDDQWLSEAANDLVAKPGASLVLAGPDQPVVVQL